MKKKLHPLYRAKIQKDNEFYTDYSTMEYLFESEKYSSLFKSLVKDKIVYLPCDAEWSNIYKYFINNQEKLQIKEIMMTSDDYYSHLELYEKADIVFTNPPFTRLMYYIDFLQSMNKQFCLWYSYASICMNYKASQLFYNNELKMITYQEKETVCFSADRSKNINVFLFTNIQDVKGVEFPMPELNNTINDISVFYNNIPVISRIKQYPKDYYNEVIMPILCLYGRERYFELVGYLKHCLIDGKYTNKVIVKRKRPENETKVN